MSGGRQLSAPSTRPPGPWMQAVRCWEAPGPGAPHLPAPGLLATLPSSLSPQCAQVAFLEQVPTSNYLGRRGPSAAQTPDALPEWQASEGLWGRVCSCAPARMHPCHRHPCSRQATLRADSALFSSSRRPGSHSSFSQGPADTPAPPGLCLFWGWTWSRPHVPALLRQVAQLRGSATGCPRARA